MIKSSMNHEAASRKKSLSSITARTNTTADTDCSRSVHSSSSHNSRSRCAAESHVSKEEMFEMLKQADTDSLNGSLHSDDFRPTLLPTEPMTDDEAMLFEGNPTKASLKQKNMVSKVQDKIAHNATATLGSHFDKPKTAKTRRIKVVRASSADGSVASSACSSLANSLDPRVLEAMKSSGGRTRITAKELEAMGVKVPTRGARRDSAPAAPDRPTSSSASPSSDKSRARSRSRPRPSPSNSNDDMDRSHRTREGESSQSRARSRSRPRPREGDDAERTSHSRRPEHDDEEGGGRSGTRSSRDHEEDRGGERREGTAHSRARSKSRPRPRESDPPVAPPPERSSHTRGREIEKSGHSRAAAPRDKSRPRQAEESGASRCRSKSRPRAGRESTAEPEKSGHRRTTGTDSSRARSKSRPRPRRDEEEEDYDHRLCDIPLVIQVEKDPEGVFPGIHNSLSHEDDPVESNPAVAAYPDASEEFNRSPTRRSVSEKCITPLKKVKALLARSPPQKENSKANSGAMVEESKKSESQPHPPAPRIQVGSPTKSRSRHPVVTEDYGDDDDDDSGSLPPIPLQIVVREEDMEPVPDESEHNEVVISGNSDDMYRKIKEAGITEEQFRRLAEAGLTIAEG